MESVPGTVEAKRLSPGPPFELDNPFVNYCYPCQITGQVEWFNRTPATLHLYASGNCTGNSLSIPPGGYLETDYIGVWSVKLLL